MRIEEALILEEKRNNINSKKIARKRVKSYKMRPEIQRPITSSSLEHNERTLEKQDNGRSQHRRSMSRQEGKQDLYHITHTNQSPKRLHDRSLQ
jgi:hypothetical protein